MEPAKLSTYAALAHIYQLAEEGKVEEASMAVSTLPPDIQKRIKGNGDTPRSLQRRVESIADEELKSRQLMGGMDRMGVVARFERLTLEGEVRAWQEKGGVSSQLAGAVLEGCKGGVLDLRKFDLNSLPRVFHYSLFKELKGVRLPEEGQIQDVMEALSALPKTCVIYIGDKIFQPERLIERVCEFAGEAIPLGLGELNREVNESLIFSLDMIGRVADPDIQKELALNILDCLKGEAPQKVEGGKVPSLKLAPFSQKELEKNVRESHLFLGGDEKKLEARVALFKKHGEMERAAAAEKQLISVRSGNERRRIEAVAQLQRVQERGDIEEKLSEVVFRLNVRGDLLESDLMKDADIEHFVLLAYMHGAISEVQLGTFFFQKSALLEGEMQKVPLFLGDRINPEAECFIHAMIAKERSSITREQVKGWFEEMRKQPASEQVFYRHLEVDAGSVVTIILKGYSLFVGIQEVEQPSHIMIPSVGMVAQFFSFEGGNVTPRITFVARHDISDNGASGTRDVVVRNGYQRTPIIADRYEAKGPKYTVHDLCFHARLVNRIPQERQKLIVDLGEYVYTSPEFAFLSPKQREKIWLDFNDMLYVMTDSPLLFRQAKDFSDYIERVFPFLRGEQKKQMDAGLRSFFDKQDETEFIRAVKGYL